LHKKWFKICFVVSIFNFQTMFDVDILDFKIELGCRYLGFFGSATVGATFFPKIGRIFSIIWSHWYWLRDIGIVVDTTISLRTSHTSKELT
jgi:hypothetical protein